MNTLPPKELNPQRPSIGLRIRADGTLETLDGVEVELAESAAENFFLASGADARRTRADLAELRRLRLKMAGGCVFKRANSSSWQLKYRVDDKWRYESAYTTDRATAERLLAFKVYEASAGLLPGTATFEEVIAHSIRVARVSQFKSLARMERAAKHLLKHLSGYRAEQVNNKIWTAYMAERLKEAAPDTVALELSIARRVYKLSKLERVIPEIPHVRNLRVRFGFIEPADYARLREHLRSDWRDACDVAFVCGAREMEALGLRWTDIDDEAVNFRNTKTGKPRTVPYALLERVLPQFVAAIERRRQVCEQLARAGVMSPYVFCFSAPVMARGRLYHRAGDPLFKDTGNRGLLASLRCELERACDVAHVPRLLFHDFRRSAARNMERAGIPRSVAKLIGGWSDRMYSRYTIGDEREIAPAMAQLGEYLDRAGWQYVGSHRKSSTKSKVIKAEGGRSRTFRRAQYPPSRF